MTNAEPANSLKAVAVAAAAPYSSAQSEPPATAGITRPGEADRRV